MNREYTQIGPYVVRTEQPKKRNKSWFFRMADLLKIPKTWQKYLYPIYLIGVSVAVYHIVLILLHLFHTTMTIPS